MKKFTAIMLAAAMAAGSVLGLVGCVPSGDNPGGDTPGGENPGGQTPTPQPPSNGIVTDAATLDALYGALEAVEIEAATFEYTMSQITEQTGEENAREKTDLAGKGALLISEDSVEFDLFGASKTTFSVEELAISEYQLAFLRGEYLYEAGGSWEDAEIEEGDFEALLSAFKGEDGLALSRTPAGEADGGFDQFASFGFLDELKSLASKVGTARKTESGYTITFTLEELAAAVIDRAIEALGTVNRDTTVSDVFENEFLNKVLEATLGSISVEEFFAMLEEQELSETAQAVVTLLKNYVDDGMSAYDFLQKILDSKAFYGALLDENDKFPFEFPEEARTLGELTVDQIYKMLMPDSNLPVEAYLLLATESLKLYKNDIAANLAQAFFASIFHFTPTEDSTVAAEIVVRFDADKNVVGFDVTGNAAGEDAETEEVSTEVSMQAEVHIELKDSVTLTDISQLRYLDYTFGDAEEGTFTY